MPGNYKSFIIVKTHGPLAHKIIFKIIYKSPILSPSTLRCPLPLRPPVCIIKTSLAEQATSIDTCRCALLQQSQCQLKSTLQKALARALSSPDGSNCTACIAGTWKAFNGSSSCILCASGKYSSETAEISEATCDDCPAQSYSGDGSNLTTNCTCHKGYSGPDGSNCTACIAGTWKAFNGSSSCVLCASGKYSSEMGAIAEDICQNCPLNYDFSLAGSGLVSACSPPTPLPWWICPCKEFTWRELWDPQHKVTWIRMVLALPYRSVRHTYTPRHTHTH